MFKCSCAKSLWKTVKASSLSLVLPILTVQYTDAKIKSYRTLNVILQLKPTLHTKKKHIMPARFRRITKIILFTLNENSISFFEKITCFNNHSCTCIPHYYSVVDLYAPPPIPMRTTSIEWSLTLDTKVELLSSQGATKLTEILFRRYSAQHKNLPSMWGRTVLM